MTSKGGYAEVIGDPVAQSKSPIIHRHWLDLAGLDFDYRPTRVARADLPTFLKDRRGDPDWRGCNVTMPLKLDAAMLADAASDRAIAASAANLLVPKEGRVLAGNTDVGAVLQLFGPKLTNGAPRDITLLGNGGAARAVLVALRILGVGEVIIQARDLSAATKLAVEFGLSEGPRPFDAPIETGGLINATPMGMAGMPPLTIDIRAMPVKGWVFDLVTNPVETALLGTARARGLTTIDGLAMLVEQAAESFMLLFGSEAPRQDDAALMARLRA
jgi:shikimate dehydrogenase